MIKLMIVFGLWGASTFCALASENGAIGELSLPVNDVRIKFHHENKWRLVRGSKVMVYPKQHIFTGANSSVELNFTTGESVKVLSNSLINIENAKKPIFIEKGSVVGEFGDREILTRKTSHPVKISGRVLLQQKKTKDYELIPIGKKVNLKVENKTVQLSHDNIVDLSSMETKKARDLRAESPGLGLEIAPQEIFRWKSLVKKGAKYEVNFYNFKREKIYSKSTSKTKLRFPVKLQKSLQGSAYWNVELRDKNNQIKERTPLQEFRVSFNLPFMLEWPKDKARTANTDTIVFRWQESPYDRKYTLVLQSLSTRKKTTYNVAKHYYKMPLKKAGIYQWWIRAHRIDDFIMTSDPRSLVIQGEYKIKLLSPKNTQVIAYKKKNKVTFKWKKNRYKQQHFKLWLVNNKKKTLIKQIRTSKYSVSVDLSRKGKYEWEVTSRDEVSEARGYGAFIIDKLAKPKLLKKNMYYEL